jgi:tetratricopeptide (TPR) repeat protein
MIRRTSIAALLLVCVAASTPAFAQEWYGRGRIRGEVTDDQGKPVAGAQVHLRMGAEAIDPANLGPGPKPLTTDRRGRWTTAGLAGGLWQVLVVKDGYIPSLAQAQIGADLGPPVRVVLRFIPPEVRAAEQAAAQQSEAIGHIEEGNRLLGEDQFAAARAAYERALALLEPANQPAVLRGVARTQYQEGQIDPAVATLQQALAIAPDDPESLQLLISVLVAAGREPEAASYIARLPSGTTLDPTVLLNLGIKHYNEGKFDEAHAEFDRAARENPELPEAYYFRGLANLALGKAAAAKVDFERLLQLAPDHQRAAEAREFLESL